MEVTRASALGVFAVLYLAESGAGPVPARRIAADLGVAGDTLVKILQQLNRWDILAVERGARGGFQLRSTPEKVTLLSVVEAIDGPMEARPRIRDLVKGKRKAKQLLTGTLEEGAATMRSLLDSTTIRDLMS